jgi:multidrug efflux pump subunit AcrA (membrane-fusion protein)
MKTRTLVTTIVTIVLIAGALFIAARNLGFIGPGSGPGGRGGEPSASAPVPEDLPVIVETITAETHTLQADVRLNGELRARDTASAHPDSAGTVSEIYVVQGDYVAKDETLALVNPSRPGAHYEQSPVLAPIDGHVIAVNIERGQKVGMDTPIVTIASISDLQVAVELPERYTAKVKPGMMGTFSSFAIDGAMFEARITEIEPLIDPRSRSKEVILEIVGKASGLEPGMFTRVSLPLHSTGEVVAVPFSALAQEAGKSYVYVVQDGIAQRRQVSTGLFAGDQVEIADGLEAGTTIVGRGMQKLSLNTPVRSADARLPIESNTKEQD